MGRHAQAVTMGTLLERYAAVERITLADAYDLHVTTPVYQLQEIVELLESHHPRRAPRRAFARTQPTTTVQGQTR